MNIDVKLGDDITAILRELKDRMRRVETRLTKFLQSQGFDTMSQQPLWKNGTVDVPSIHCSIKDAMSVIPADWDEDIVIVHKRQPVMVWSKWEEGWYCEELESKDVDTPIVSEKGKEYL